MVVQGRKGFSMGAAEVPKVKRAELPSEPQEPVTSLIQDFGLKIFSQSHSSTDLLSPPSGPSGDPGSQGECRDTLLIQKVYCWTE